MRGTLDLYHNDKMHGIVNRSKGCCNGSLSRAIAFSPFMKQQRNEAKSDSQISWENGAVNKNLSLLAAFFGLMGCTIQVFACVFHLASLEVLGGV
jgi:hypothetical protein